MEMEGVVTNNKKIYKSILGLRTHGAIKKFKHEFIGINSRLDTVQASILNEKLKGLILSIKEEILQNIILRIQNKKIYLFKKILKGLVFINL